MLKVLFDNLSDNDKNNAIANIIEHATPRLDFFVMMMLSVAMAAFGILLNSVVILIGSMLIAPLLYPVLSLGLGIITADGKLMGHSFYTILKSSLLAIIASFVIGLLFSGSGSADFIPYLASGSSSLLMYVIIAAIAGFAAALAVAKPYLNETLPGVAISVALVPPLAVMGVGLSTLKWTMFSDALLIFIVNIIGIMFSSMIVFSLFKFSRKRKVTEEAVKEEEKVIKKESKEKEIGKNAPNN